MEDLNRSEIYFIVNTVNNKKYVGKAAKYVSQNNNKWGTEVRWKSHLREAFNPYNKDHCVLLNNALRKYGRDAFTVTKICDADSSEIDEKEIYYIELHNSLVPNGYNIRAGGNDGMHAHYERKEARLLEPKPLRTRKNEEDKDLPKNIIALRSSGVLTGYKVEISIRNSGKEHYTKAFKDTENPANALELAIKDLADLKLANPVTKPKARERVTDKTVINNYIYPIIKEYKIACYVVKNMVNNEGVEIPEKIFDGNTNRWNLDKAKKYVTQVESIIKNNIEISDWNNIDTIAKIHKKGVDGEYLPKYIRIIHVKNVKKGYCVDGFRVNGQKLASKSFTNIAEYTMKELYDQAVSYLNELYAKYENKSVGM